MSRVLPPSPEEIAGPPPELPRTAGKINAYLLDLDRLLARIERATTHYQVFGVEVSAGRDEVDSAFRDALAMLYPPYPVSATLPAGLLRRVELGFNKLCQAFSALANLTRRRVYDAALVAREFRPVESPVIPAAKPDTTNGNPTARRGLYMESRRAQDSNRRRTDRLKISIPVRVVGYDRKAGKWSEMAETLDVSTTGLRLRLLRPVRYGMVLYLSLPYPVRLRSHGFAENSYRVYGLVRRVDPTKKGSRTVGIEFVGEQPPTGFLEKPWATFRTKRWSGSERRRAPRLQHSEQVRIEYISESTNATTREEAVTENVSRTGLRVIVRAAPAEFDLVRVISATRQFDGLATLRNRFIAKDGRERICLHFLTREWPV